jgi:hypothetical protein
MKCRIRKGVFETNSSSMHSLVIKGEKKINREQLKINENGFIEVETDDYTWGYFILETVQEKLNYVVACKINEDDLYLFTNDSENNSKHLKRLARAGIEFIKLEEMLCEITGAKGIEVNLTRGCSTEQSLDELVREDLSILDIIFDDSIQIEIKDV